MCFVVVSFGFIDASCIIASIRVFLVDLTLFVVPCFFPVFFFLIFKLTTFERKSVEFEETSVKAYENILINIV